MIQDISMVERKYIKRGGDLDNQEPIICKVLDGEFVTGDENE